MTRSLAARAAGEAVGTFLLVGIGTGAIVVAHRIGGVPSWAVAIAWFFAVLLPILLFVNGTGAHLNPAVTLALAGSGRFSWRRVPAYLTGQLAGALLASGILRGVLGDVARLGSTTPTGDLLRAFAGEAVFTAALVASVFLLSDRGAGLGRWRLLLPPGVVGISTYVIGPWSGSSLNPARTLGPAIVSGTFTDLWLYLVAVPMGAGLVAALWRPAPADRRRPGAGRNSGEAGSFRPVALGGDLAESLSEPAEGVDPRSK